MPVNPSSPCIDCITLSVCKAYLQDYHKSTPRQKLRLLSNLTVKCSILNDYYIEKGAYSDQYIDIDYLLARPIINS